MEKEKKSSALSILLICVAIFSIGKLGYRFFQSHQEKTQLETSTTSEVTLYALTRNLQQQRYDNMDLFIAEVNKETPTADDEHFTFVNMSRDADDLIFTVKVKPGVNMNDVLQDMKELAYEHCTDEGMREILDSDFNIKIIYIDNDDKKTESPRITRSDCMAFDSMESRSQ